MLAFVIVLLFSTLLNVTNQILKSIFIVVSVINFIVHSYVQVLVVLFV